MQLFIYIHRMGHQVWQFTRLYYPEFWEIYTDLARLKGQHFAFAYSLMIYKSHPCDLGESHMLQEGDEFQQVWLDLFVHFERWEITITMPVDPEKSIYLSKKT